MEKVKETIKLERERNVDKSAHNKKKKKKKKKKKQHGWLACEREPKRWTTTRSSTSSTFLNIGAILGAVVHERHRDAAADNDKETVIEQCAKFAFR